MIYMAMAVTGGLIFLVALYALYRIHLLLTPTRGKRIDSNRSGGEALLVIDVQRDFTQKTGRGALDPKDVERKIQSINRAAAEASAAGIPVLAISQVTRGFMAKTVARMLMGPEGLEGSGGIDPDDRLAFQPDACFEKDRGDAFSNPMLPEWLQRHQVGRLRLMGLDGCYCVAATARGALSRGYRVELAEDAIMTAFPDRWREVRDRLSEDGMLRLA